MSIENSIYLKGINTNNLKNIDLTIPKNKIVLVTGKSGSGKKSLVFDTLFATGYLKYLETLSPKIQNKLEKLKRAEYDEIKNLPPVVSLDAYNKKSSQLLLNVLELYEDIKFIFSKLSLLSCLECGYEIEIHDIQDIVNKSGSKTGKDLYILFEYQGDIAYLLNRGYYFYFEAGQIKKIGKDQNKKNILVLSDKVQNTPQNKTRLNRAIKGAINYQPKVVQIYADKKFHYYPLKMYCPRCRIDYPVPGTDLFRFKLGKKSSVRDLIFTKIALNYKINGHNINELLKMTLGEIHAFLNIIGKGDFSAHMLRYIKNLTTKLRVFIDFDLSEIAINRRIDSLSSGEREKIKLIMTFQMNLNNMLILINQLSSLYYPLDFKKVKKLLIKIKNKGNSLIIIGNHNKLVEITDYVIKLGPGFGQQGGEVVFSGERAMFLSSERKEFSKVRQILKPFNSISPLKEIEWIKISNKTIDQEIRIPKRALTLLLGPSGCGKTSILINIYNYSGGNKKKVHFSNLWTKKLSAKSMVISYLNIFKDITKILAKQHNSKVNNFLPGDFSNFSMRGKCSECKGMGFIREEIDFLLPIEVKCLSCDGKGIKPGPAKITFRGKTISEVLKMDLYNLKEYLKGVISREKMEVLNLTLQFDLGFLISGQRLNTLSESILKRLFLIEKINNSLKNSLILLDNFSYDLDRDDKKNLLDIFQIIIKNGNSIIISDNDIEMVNFADYIIFLNYPKDKTCKVDFQGMRKEYFKEKN